MRVQNIFRYEGFIFVGIIMAVLVLIKLLGHYDISSDWFWFIGAIGLVVEGTISLFRQKAFDTKFKVLSREEYESLLDKAK